MELTTNYGWSMPEPTDPVNSSAEYAENMELIDGVVKDIADEVTAVDQGLTALATTVAGKVSKAGDTMTGDLNMGGNGIKGIATASISSGTDAVNKQYVDNVATADCIKKDGSVDFEANQSMGGHKLTNLPTSGSYNAGDAIPKQYVTDNAVTYAEGLTSDLNANNQKISSLGTPTFNYDAATKKYVDDADADKVSKSDTAKQTIQSILMFDEGGGIGWDGTTDGVKVYAPNASSEGDLTCANLYASAIEAAGIENHNGRITGVGSPINNADAATKGYVDSLFFDVKMTFSSPATTPAIDKTYTEIKSAIDAGKMIRLRYKQAVRDGMSLNYFYNNGVINFVIDWTNGNTTSLRFVSIDSSNVVSMYTRTLS